MIPRITDPLGRHWRQPALEDVLVDDEYAVTSCASFDKLAEYSTSIPTGVYPGKMWKAVFGDRAFLRWFGIVEAAPMCVRTTCGRTGSGTEKPIFFNKNYRIASCRASDVKSLYELILKA